MSSSFNLKFIRGEDFASLKEEDLEFIFKLDKEFFPNPWTLPKWKQVKSSELGPCLLVLAYESCELIGFSLFGIGDPDTAHLYKILVSPRLRGSALSGDLLTRCEGYLKELKVNSVYLEVEQSNLRALGFYQKHGYQVLVAKKDFYGTGRDAFALEHILS